MRESDWSSDVCSSDLESEVGQFDAVEKATGKVCRDARAAPAELSGDSAIPRRPRLPAQIRRRAPGRFRRDSPDSRAIAQRRSGARLGHGAGRNDSAIKPPGAMDRRAVQTVRVQLYAAFAYRVVWQPARNVIPRRGITYLKLQISHCRSHG